jgi:heme/copper-type cytochrome/quinol oxidase subunit 2
MAVSGAHDPTLFVVVFGIFLLLSAVLAVFVVRFAVKLNRERSPGGPRPKR